MGLKGKIVEKFGNDFFVLKFFGSEDEVRVGLSDVVDLGFWEEERCFKELKDKEKDKKASKRSRGIERVSRNEVRVSEKYDRGERRVKKFLWFRSYIKVRIVSKDFKSGRLYFKKGKVVDVVGLIICDIMMDEM